MKRRIFWPLRQFVSKEFGKIRKIKCRSYSEGDKGLHLLLCLGGELPFFSSLLGFFPHEIDHFIAEKHGGKTESDNLAYACWRCNRHKGTDLGSFDPETNGFSPLLNPRMQMWTEHFEFEGEQIIGLTSEVRTTVSLLQLNSDDRLAERASLQGKQREEWSKP